MNIEYYDRIWQEGRREKESARDFWDGRAEEFNTLPDDDRPEMVTELLLSRDMLKSDGAVLDIGCGPGKFSLALGEHSDSVLGIDLSGRMIDLARENAVSMNRVSFENISWEDSSLSEKGWEKKFDLVFASMCPGIFSAETLLKMCRASRGACYLSSFASRTDPVAVKLSQAMGRSGDRERWEKHMYAVFNILWLSGYFPEISYYKRKSVKSMSAEDAAAIYCRYMNIDKGDTDGRGFVESYIDSSAGNGILLVESESTVAMMTWRV